MHTILLISRDEGLKEQMEALLEELEWRLSWLKFLPVPADAAEVLLLGDDFWTSASADQLSDLRKQLPNAQVILLAPLSRRQEMQRLLRIYADDYLILPLDKEEVVSVLQKCDERLQRQDGSIIVSGKIVVCFSPLGRCGKTSLAINLAVALAEKAERGVALLDLAAPFGDVALATGMTVEEPLEVLVHQEPALWKKKMVQLYDYNVWLGVVASSVDKKIRFDYDGMAAVLKSLQGEFDFILIDTAADFSSQEMAALDAADTILLLAVLEQVSSVKNIRACLEIFHSLGYDAQKVRLILNRATAKYNLQIRDVERILDHPIARRLPNDFELVKKSLARKLPYVKMNPQSSLSIETAALADVLRDGHWEREISSGGLFAKWFS